MASLLCTLLLALLSEIARQSWLGKWAGLAHQDPGQGKDPLYVGLLGNSQEDMDSVEKSGHHKKPLSCMSLHGSLHIVFLRYGVYFCFCFSPSFSLFSPSLFCRAGFSHIHLPCISVGEDAGDRTQSLLLLVHYH